MLIGGLNNPRRDLLFDEDLQFYRWEGGQSGKGNGGQRVACGANAVRLRPYERLEKLEMLGKARGVPI